MADIGILTFQNTLNFGASLQCYALYNVIQQMGFDVQVINYNNPIIATREFLVPDRGLKSVIKVMLNKPKARKFEAFLHRMNVSPSCDKSNFKEIANQYDGIVVGSDQVWNPECTGYDTTYFLDLVDSPIVKLSYAASIGLNHFPDCGIDYGALLGQFSSLLVREKTASEEISRYVDKPINIVLDPTLLLSLDSWKNIVQIPRSVRGKRYVLVYSISESELSLRAARRIAKEKNLEIVFIQQYKFNRVKDAINMRNISPEEFVGLFLGADVAVVSSFHGLCFSIISGTDFLYASDSGKSSRASRLLDLMTLLGIERRSVSDYFNGEMIPLNWDQVFSKLDNERIRSRNALTNSLGLVRSSQAN
ncbi:Polysaccharide pyruvyl transferase [Bifidobacterium thermophilum]|uniref:Polysaccharide pyruvyl transferase n=1 Tax=Bifidobacterium thermophilum TaxID=33905 RepID=A0A2N3QPK1_9BIFI|nr:polysaccharide pyruvyl transferase family protein [Bifidobacterium thermophilum]PKU93554.1 Polysaccharide pyruvyl transferase [Bifidobacterium thermophilum]